MSKKLVDQFVLCESVRADLAEQQKANAELISANNDLHDDNTAAQNENRMLTARIGTLTELCHDTDGRVTQLQQTIPSTLVSDYSALDDHLLLMESHVATQFTTETVSEMMSHLLTHLTDAASAHQEDTDAIAMMTLETSRDLVEATHQAKQ